MIRGPWYVILYSSQVGPKQPTGVLRLGEKLVAGDQPVLQFRENRDKLLNSKK